MGDPHLGYLDMYCIMFIHLSHKEMNLESDILRIMVIWSKMCPTGPFVLGCACYILSLKRHQGYCTDLPYAGYRSTHTLPHLPKLTFHPQGRNHHHPTGEEGGDAVILGNIPRLLS